MILSSSSDMGLFWDRLCLSGAVFIPSTQFHFVMAYAHGIKRFKWFIRGSYLISLFFLIAVWLSHRFIADVQPKFGMNYFTVPGPLYALFILFFSVNVAIALITLWRYSEITDNAKIKKQTKLLFWTSVIGYVGGGCNYLLVFDINLPGVAETSNYGVLLLSVCLTYIIFRYRFLDIEFIFRKTVVFAGLLAFVFGVFSIAMLLVQRIFSEFLGDNDVWTYVVSLFLIVLGYDPIRNMLLNLTDKYLFQKK
jgi:hypothetical protein